MTKERTLLILDFILLHRLPVSSQMIADNFNVHLRTASRYIKLILSMSHEFSSMSFEMVGEQGYKYEGYKILGRIK